MRRNSIAVPCADEKPKVTEEVFTLERKSMVFTVLLLLIYSFLDPK